jgi:nitrite reductase/ring-hydroxylating ferredoxin subunit
VAGSFSQRVAATVLARGTHGTHEPQIGEPSVRTLRVPIRPVRGVGSTRSPCLYEAQVDDELYVAWEGPAGDLRATSARCPHRPRHAALHLRGVLNGDALICTIHGNVYSTTTGKCIAVGGVGDPGRLAIVAARREGDQMVLQPQSSGS